MASGRDVTSREVKKEFDIDKALQKKEFAEFLSRYPDGESLLEVHDAKSLEALAEIHDKFQLKEKATKDVSRFIDSTIGGELRQAGIEFSLSEEDTEAIGMHLENNVKEQGGEDRLKFISEDIKEFAEMKEEIAKAEAALKVELDKLGGSVGLERRKELLSQAEKAGVDTLRGGRLFGLGRSDQGKLVLKQLKDEFGIEVGHIGGQVKSIAKAEKGLAKLEEMKEALNKAKEMLVIAAGGEEIVFKAIQTSIGRQMVKLFEGDDIREARKVYGKLAEAGKGTLGLDYLAEARKQGINAAEIEKYVAKAVDREIDEVFGNLEIKNHAYGELEKGLKEILEKDRTDASAKKRLIEILEKKKAEIRKSEDGRIKALFLARIMAKLHDQMF